MDLLNSHTAAQTAIATFAANHAGALPDALRAKFIEATSSLSPVVQMCDTAELLYANAASIADSTAKAAAMTLAAQCAAWAAAPGNSFHGMGQGGANGMSRGVAIYQAMARELGETAPAGTNWPEPSDDPAVSAAWTLAAAAGSPSAP